MSNKEAAPVKESANSTISLKLSVLNASVVVLAEAHNPSILHPAFLVAQGIVPQDWGLAEPPVCTPAISLAKYANDIVFTVEVGKFQVLHNAPSPQSPLPELASKYLEALPHVHYTAVGVNVAGYVECEDPQHWLLERFVRPGAWNDAVLRPNAVGIKLVYPVEGAILNLSLDAGSVHRIKEQREMQAVLVSGNYHTAVPPERALAEAKLAIGRYHERVEQFDRMTHLVLGLET